MNRRDRPKRNHQNRIEMCPEASKSIAAAACTFDSIITSELVMAGAVSREIINSGCPECIDFYIFNVCAMQYALLQAVEKRFPQIGSAIDEEFEKILQQSEVRYESLK